MRNDFTITEGEIHCADLTCKIPFALVFNDDGVFYIETFLPDKDFYEETKGKEFYQLTGKTEKGYDIEIDNLSLRRFKYSSLKLELICYGKLTLSDNRKEPHEQEEAEIYDNSIYVVEVEGLKMKFAHHTTIEKYRNDGKVNDFSNFDFDHTTCAMTINFSEREGNYYKLIFTKNHLNDNVIIDFTKHEGYNRLTYKNYLKIKDDFFSFLSFINGGHVVVRKELTGWFITSSGNEYTNSQCVNIYSRNKVNANQLSSFIPINEHHSYSSSIVPHMFINCFDHFYRLNKQLDFTSLVFSLNNSTETIGLEEKYFILITALEKVCTNYSKTIREPKKTLINNAYFVNTIKSDLDNVLKKHEASIKQDNPSAWAIFKSKLGNLNKSNKAETAQKLYELFTFSKIQINSEIENLIESERNVAVHEGVIGATEHDRIKNYWKLDHILRDIILNLIDYKSYRNYVFKYYEARQPDTKSLKIKMMTIFAYGSNMNFDRLQKRVPSAIKISNAFIKGYKFKCNKVSQDGSAKANIVLTNIPEDIVWGVIFQIDINEKPKLDKEEGLGKGYNETTLTFIDINNNNQQAQVYVAENSSINNELRPYDWYREFVLTGARQNQLPEDYIETIESLEFIVDQDEERRQKNYNILGA